MRFLVAAIVLLCLASAALAQNTPDPLKNGFENPPSGARPRVWWHWMNGNITKEGIKLDLEWMHRVGMAGFQNFDAALHTPQVVDKRLAYMTPEWKDAFKYATTLGRSVGHGRGDRRLAGLERIGRSLGAGIAGNEEVCVERDRRGRRKAVHGQAGSSASQHRRISEHRRSRAIRTARAPSRSAVLCRCRGRCLSAGPQAMYRLKSLARENHGQRRLAGSATAERWRSGEDNESCRFRRLGQSSGFSIEFQSPQTIRSITFVTKDPRLHCRLVTESAAPEKTLEASDDGQNFRTVDEAVRTAMRPNTPFRSRR